MYKIDVPQGNIVTQEMVDQLSLGMSKRQVSYAMGTPLVVDVFHPDRWDYIYSFKKGGDKAEQRRMTLHFDADRLARIEGDYQPRPGMAGVTTPRETTVVVTPPPEKKGFFSRLFGSDDKAPANKD